MNVAIGVTLGKSDNPSVPTTGKAVTASVPWIEFAVAGAMGVVTVFAPKLIVTVTPGTKVVLV